MSKLSRFCRIVLPLLALTIIVLTLPGSAQQPQKPTSTEDSQVDLSSKLVSLSVSVTDHHGRSVTGLQRENFEVFEGKSPQKIELFAAEDAPLTIGIVIDRSYSMLEGNKFERVLDAARTFVDLSNPDDEFFLALFSDKMTIEQDIAKGREQIRKAIDHVKSPMGTTLLYDSVYALVNKLNRYETANHKALIIITDGEDTSSIRDSKDVIKFVGSTNVQVYAIGVFGSDYVPTAKRFLSDTSDSSGGKAFFPGNSKGLSKIWSEIADDLRHQYGLAYSPSNSKMDGTWRQIDVRVKKPDGYPNLKIRARKGYFAPVSAGVQPAWPLPGF